MNMYSCRYLSFFLDEMVAKNGQSSSKIRLGSKLIVLFNKATLILIKTILEED